ASMSTVCPAFRLRVSWEPPVGTFVIGGYLAPLGPPPTITTRQVNGVVMCQGSTYAYLGFEAAWDGIRWTVTGVPASGDDDHPRLRGDDTAPGLVPADAAAIVLPAAGDAQSVPPGVGWGPAIEPLAVYQPQATCDPLAKPGVVGFRDLVLHSFPGGRDLGIGQVCDAPDGVSEHKEGRAFDFGVRVEDPAERAMAEQLLAWLFATDQYGNQYAMIRRLGVMYIIWDRHIWGAYKPEEGWRPYEGVSPHTDHIHLSFSWPGALGQTSFWTGHVGDVGRVGSTPGAVPPHDLPPEAAAPAPPPDAPADGTAGAPAGPTPAVAAPGSNTGPASATGPPAGSPASPGSSGGSSPSSTTTTTAPPPATTPPPPPPPSAPIPTTVPTVPHFP
ncbi:MAG: hypothetical protein QOG64_1845, partial [Acidimicrobiaceae bacterium]|nr:hypothetical protein [Acidimicrobiaceae bacterium]